MQQNKRTKKIVRTDFKKTVTITKQLIEDLKQGKQKLAPGQWCYSQRDKTYCRYIGTFLRSENGVIGPIVRFSYRQPSQTLLDWNRTFKYAKEKSEVEDRRLRLIKQRTGQVNTRKDFTKPRNEREQIVRSSPSVHRAEEKATETPTTVFSRMRKSVYRFFSRIIWPNF